MGDVDLRTTLGAVPIQRDVVRVHGPEALGYLQGQLSQDVEALEVDRSAPSLLLQPSGKVDAWLRVTRTAEDEALLDVQAGFGDAVLRRLSRFKLRMKLELSLSAWSGLAIRGPGADQIEVPTGASGMVAGWPGVEGLDLLSDGELALAGVPLAAPGALDALRIECGVPAMGAELTEDTIPAEAGQWLIDTSVSFTKGCYTGQELVARIDSRGGNVPRPIRGLVVEGAPVPVGAEIWLEHAAAGGAVVGAVTSSGTSPALGSVALARVGRAVGAGQRVEVRWGDGDLDHRYATVAELPLR